MAHQTGFNSPQPQGFFPQSPGQAQSIAYNYAPSYGTQYYPTTPPPLPSTAYGPSYTYLPPSTHAHESPPVSHTSYGQPQPAVTDLARMVTQTVRQEFQQEMSQLRREIYQSQEELYQSQQQTQQMCLELRDRVDYLSYVEHDRRSTTQHLFSLGGAFLGAAFGGPVMAVTTIVGAFGGSALGYVGGTAMHENSSGSVARREEIQTSKKYLDILQAKA